MVVVPWAQLALSVTTASLEYRRRCRALNSNGRGTDSSGAAEPRPASCGCHRTLNPERDSALEGEAGSPQNFG